MQVLYLTEENHSPKSPADSPYVIANGFIVYNWVACSPINAKETMNECICHF